MAAAAAVVVVAVGIIIINSTTVRPAPFTVAALAVEVAEVAISSLARQALVVPQVAWAARALVDTEVDMLAVMALAEGTEVVVPIQVVEAVMQAVGMQAMVVTTGATATAHQAGVAITAVTMRLQAGDTAHQEGMPRADMLHTRQRTLQRILLPLKGEVDMAVRMPEAHLLVEGTRDTVNRRRRRHNQTDMDTTMEEVDMGAEDGKRTPDFAMLFKYHRPFLHTPNIYRAMQSTYLYAMCRLRKSRGSLA